MQKFPLDSYAYSLARIRWDVFGTLTFRSVPSPKKAYGRAWALMRLTAELVQRPYSQLLLALRAELGELTGRFHFHFLLGGTNTRNEITLAQIMDLRPVAAVLSPGPGTPANAGICKDLLLEQGLLEMWESAPARHEGIAS